jgi:methionine-rich copper-binding protein CopC
MGAIPTTRREETQHPRVATAHLDYMSRIVGRLAVALLSLAWTAYGHAIVLSATPAKGQEVSGPDFPITLRFNSRIDPKRSRLTLLMPDGRQTTLDLSEAATRDILVSKAKGLKSGSYLLRWQVLATDGHITRGEVPFRVK